MLTQQVHWMELSERILNHQSITKDEALAVLTAPDEDILMILHAAYQIRHHYFGNKVKLNMIINAKSGLCPEDCGYCSQSIIAKNPVPKYSFVDKDTIVKGAFEAVKRGAGTYCISASGRRPGRREIKVVEEAVKEIREKTNLKICACLGLLTDDDAKRLKKAGVHRYNHNLNTHKNRYPKITTTHTYQDRVNTVKAAKKAGISPCTGCVVGMGETDEELYELAVALRDIQADSIPVNFLNPQKGTPLENQKPVSPYRALKTLAMMRFVNPSAEIRVSAGRETSIRSLQPLALYPANAIFVGDYLTTKGQEAEKDHQMIEDLGFEIERSAVPYE